MIIIHELTKKYKSNIKGEEVVALDNIDLFLPDKGFIAIYGASGCGKSTLLNVLGGLDQADFGTMIVNGRDTSGFKAHDWNSYRNQEVGFIFQNYYLLPHLTVFDNIAITLQMSKQTKGMKKKIHDALSQVGLSNMARRYPRQLSGGQQQRVAIARALVTNPAIILADEPTGALDEKSSLSVMKTLQEISKEHLVVMVTHNERMAKEYADRMIEISYGKIIQDDLIQQETDEIICKSPLFKVHLPLRTSLKWSARNVVKKKGRSIPIAIASGIGLASVGIVLSMTRGVNDYASRAQQDAMSQYPVYVSCYPKNSSESAKDDLEEFPNSSDIIIEKSDYAAQEHYISMQKDFMDYMAAMPNENYEHYEHVTTNVAVNFNLFTIQSKDTYVKVSSTTYTQCIAPSDAATFDFIEKQYKFLEGHLPTNADEFTLVVDTYNRVDLMDLQNMGFDTSGTSIKAKDIIGKEYHIVSNDNLYELENPGEPITEENYYKKKGSAKYQELYETKNEHTVKIVGIIRPKTDSPNPIFKNGLIYHPSLLDSVVTPLNNNSEIVTKQKELGITCDVLSGKEFKTIYQSGYEISANYQLESRLVDLGGAQRVTSLYYYTKEFEQRTYIMDYVEAYKFDDESNIVVRTKDFLELVTSEFSSVVRIFSTVLLIFSAVSILVSAILTAILTYISVIERKREIGLLRSLGARKRDVSTMFIVESVIIGIAAGLLGIILCYSLAPLVANIVVNMVDMAKMPIMSSLTAAEFSRIQPWLIPVMLFGAVLVGVISSLIPALIAGKRKPAESLRE